MGLTSFHNLPTTLYCKFPWLNGSSEVLFELITPLGENLQDLDLQSMIALLFSKFPDLVNRIEEFFTNIVQSEEKITTPTNDLDNLALYPLLQIIISLLGNRILSNAFQNTYAKHCSLELNKTQAISEYPNKIIEKICQNVDIDCRLTRKKQVIDKIQYPFTMEMTSFLSTASKLKEDQWKLINNHVIDGQVYLLRSKVIHLLREEVRVKVRPDFKSIDASLKEELEHIPQIQEILKLIESLISQHTDRFNSSLLADGEKIGSDLFAPCIRMILYKAEQGENLSHNERLAIAFYFLNTNHTIEETVDIFRTSPDFDESIARYQVEFAAGSGGKGKKYSMFSCAKLKSLHLCYATHPKLGESLCVKGAKKRNGEIVTIHNPAGDYLFWKKIELNRLHRSQLAAVEAHLPSQSEESSPSKESLSSKEPSPSKQSSPSTDSENLKESSPSTGSSTPEDSSHPPKETA